MLSAEVEQVLRAAFQEARAKRLAFINIDYLLLHLLDEPTVNNHVSTLGGDVGTMQKQLRRFVYKTLPVIEEDGAETESAQSLQRVLERAVTVAGVWRHPLVAGLHVLDAIFVESETEAVNLLNRHGIVKESVGEAIGTAAIFQSSPPPPDGQVQAPVAVAPTGSDLAHDPFRLDTMIRSTIQACWQGLPPERRNPDTLDEEVMRLTRRALRDFREDFEHQDNSDSAPS